MKRKAIATGTALLTALLATTGLAVAEPLALVTGEGGGQVAGQVDGNYHADASGAMDKAHETNAHAQAQANEHVRSTSETFEETKWRTYENASDIDKPDAPQCECEDALGQLEQAGSASAHHADKVEKAANVESQYVDAGADVTGTVEANAWYNNLFQGAQDLVTDAQSLMGFDTHADEDAKQVAESTLETEDQIRGELVDQAHLDQQLPDAEPKLDGNLNAQHATDVATSAAGDGTATIQP